MDTHDNARSQADGYQKFSSVGSALRDSICGHEMAKLTPVFERYVPSPRSLIEIGFSDGMLMEKMRERYPGARIHGSEVRRDCVERARQRGFAAYQATDENIPGSETFDIVFGTGALHHFSDPARFLRLSFDRLNPGGLLFFSCEAHRYEMPQFAYVMLRRLWAIEKNYLRLTKRKLRTVAADLAPVWRVWYDDASYLAPFPRVHRVYRLLRANRMPFVSQLHIFLVKPGSTAGETVEPHV